MQEHRCRQHVEHMSDAVHNRMAGPLHWRRCHGESCGEHQRALTACRSSPPSQNAADDVRDHDPGDQERPQTWPVQLITDECEHQAGGENADSGDRDGPEHPRLRRVRMLRRTRFLAGKPSRRS